MKYKTISPIILVIVLLIIAVTIGLIIMNIGKGKLEAYAKCSIDTEMKMSEICYSGSEDKVIIKFILDNGDNIDIQAIHFSAAGSIQTYAFELANSAIKKQDILMKVVPYDFNSYGMIQQITLTPKIIVRAGEPSVFCSQQALIIEDIRECE